MSQFQFSQVSDPTKYDISIPVYSGPTFLCEACCPNGQLYCDEGIVYFDCPDHLRITFDNGKIANVESRGLRS